MRLPFTICFLIVFITMGNSIYGARTVFERRNQLRQKNDMLHQRQKRFLVFPPNGGTAKYVAGYLGPIDTPKYINCNAIRNFQYQYDLPANLSLTYQYYSEWTRPKSRSFGAGDDEGGGEHHVSFKPDSSRKIAYELIEEVLSREGKNGRQCLLRTICEVAETPLRHNGIVGELLETLFTPGAHESIHEDFRDAQRAGLHHIDCVRMFPDCPFGDGILDTFSILKEYNLANVMHYW